MSCACGVSYPLPLQNASHLHKRQMVSHGNEPVIVPSDMNVIENVKRRVYFSCDTLHHRKLRGFTGKTAVSDRQEPAEQMITLSLRASAKLSSLHAALVTGFWDRLVNPRNKYVNE